MSRGRSQAPRATRDERMERTRARPGDRAGSLAGDWIVNRRQLVNKVDSRGGGRQEGGGRTRTRLLILYN
ncbi:hypothetical protein JYU34_007826 [Plutella xylostella]|uniref:Uncharacterized protein n=1 Tax=Plutella xylostella TaxID=51655 RepID=A0ABQ7QRG0_PLUXY|nr:hypothetical protein JYU34_007826 [Plutella xylostella]